MNTKKIIESYKDWCKANNFIEYYGDFESEEDLVFIKDKDTIDVHHPDGAEDYGEGDEGGVHGFIAPISQVLGGEFKTTIPFPTDSEEWDDHYSVSKRVIKNTARRLGLVLDIMEDIDEARPRVFGKNGMWSCTPTELINYVNFFREISSNCSAFDEETSYWSWTVVGNDDYYCFKQIDEVWYVFYITRYDPNY